MEVGTLERDYRLLARVMHCKQAYALGGEPLLHPDICGILDAIRRSGIGDEVCVLTNGRFLDRVPEAFWGKLNVLRISVYPNLPREIIRLAEDKAKRHGFYLGLDYVDVFWKQFAVSPRGESFRDCPWKGACWTVHEGHFYLCPQSAFFTDQFLGLPQSIDGFPITETMIEEDLMRYINRTNPLTACRICKSYAVRVPWEQAETLEEWIKKSTL